MAITEPEQSADKVAAALRQRSHADAGPGSQSTFNARKAMVVIVDWLAIAAGLVVAWLLDGGLGPAWSALFGAAFWVAMVNLNLYNSRLATARSVELGRVARSGIRATLALGLAILVLGLEVSLASAMVALLATVATVSVEREVVRQWFARKRRAGQGLWQSVLVADPANSDSLRRSIQSDRNTPHLVVDDVDPTVSGDDAEDLLTRTLTAARRSGAQGVIVVESHLEADMANSLVRGLLEAHLYVDLASNLNNISADRLATRSLGSTIATWIAPRPRGGWRGRAKRLFDVSVAGLVLLAVSPIFVVLALAVKFTSPGPIFFRQERVGRWGEPFKMIKFRSMVVDAEEKLKELAEANEGAGPLFKMKDDPRVTKLGSFMRKTSLDELPQLLNVLGNDMSLVGPRPALKEEMAEWDPELYARLEVKPGITGMWQVSGRSGTSFEEYTRLDLYYVHNWSLFVDIGIMAKTIPAVLRSEGAY